MSNEDNLEDLLNNPESPNPEPEVPYGSEEWHDYVMKHFRPDELADGNPTTDGLRRVAELILGPILNSEADVVQCPFYTGKMISIAGKNHPLVSPAVVKHKVDIDCIKIDRIVRTFTEVASVSIENTDYEYYLHSVETASTKAEARALRKALKLRRVISQEEKAVAPVVVDEVVEVEETITSAEKALIKMLCGKKRVDQSKFISENTDGKYSVMDTLDDMPRTTAKRLIALLQGEK